MDPALKAILAKRQSLSADSAERVLSPEDAKQNWPRASAPAAAAKPPDWRAELAAARAKRRQSDSPLEAKELPPGDSPLKPAPRPPWEADGGNVARLRKSMQAAAPAAGAAAAGAARSAAVAPSPSAPPVARRPAARRRRCRRRRRRRERRRSQRRRPPPCARTLASPGAVAMIERHRALGDGGASAASAEAGGGGGEGAAGGALWAQLVAVTEQKEALEVELATSVAGAARLELITSAITARLREQLAALAAGGLTTTEERRHYAALQELLAYQEQLQDAPDEQLPERSRPTVARPLPGTPDGAAAGAAAVAGAPRRRCRRRSPKRSTNWSSSTGEVMPEAARKRPRSRQRRGGGSGRGGGDNGGGRAGAAEARVAELSLLAAPSGGRRRQQREAAAAASAGREGRVREGGRRQGRGGGAR